jgi:hypothetical protein
MAAGSRVKFQGRSAKFKLQWPNNGMAAIRHKRLKNRKLILDCNHEDARFFEQIFAAKEQETRWIDR